MRHTSFTADGVTRVGLVQKHVRARIVHAKVNHTLIDDVLGGILGQTRLM